MTYKDACSRLTALITEGRQTFAKASPDSLDLFGRQVIQTYLDRAGIAWDLGLLKAGPAYTIKVNDSGIAYLDLLPIGSYEGQETEEFVFYWQNRDNEMEPDQASMYLIAKTHPGMRVTTVKNDNGDTVHKFTTAKGTVTTVWPKGWNPWSES